MADGHAVTAPADARIGDVPTYCRQLGERARSAWRQLAAVDGGGGGGGGRRSEALRAAARQLLDRADPIVEANRLDLAAAQSAGLSAAMIDRLRVDRDRLGQMSRSVAEIAGQADPVGQIVSGTIRPNGIRLEKIRTPIGVILMIYESRPNVTSDAAALCVKSGNAVILRGGKEARHTNDAIAEAVRSALGTAGLDPDIVQLVQVADRSAVGHLLRLEGTIDLAIPRGGESLIRAVVEEARIPVIKHYTGNCQIYVDADCDDAMAQRICVNAKVQKPGVCNAVETILFHRQAAERGLLKRICTALADHGVQIRGDEATLNLFAGGVAAGEEDWSTEYLDLICAVRVVDGLDEALEHIDRYGSRHTDAIVTNSIATADTFTQRVDSANIFVNCSTRFSDGGEYGLGAEIGISTDKLHARGPMGADDLTTTKWIMRGSGQVRE